MITVISRPGSGVMFQVEQTDNIYKGYRYFVWLVLGCAAAEDHRHRLQNFCLLP